MSCPLDVPQVNVQENRGKLDFKADYASICNICDEQYLGERADHLLQEHKYDIWLCRIQLGLESRRFKRLKKKKPKKRIPEAICDSDPEENKAAPTAGQGQDKIIPKIEPTTSSEHQAIVSPRRIVPTPIPSTSFAGEGFSSPPRQFGVVSPIKIVLVRCDEEMHRAF